MHGLGIIGRGGVAPVRCVACTDRPRIARCGPAAPLSSRSASPRSAVSRTARPAPHRRRNRRVVPPGGPPRRAHTELAGAHVGSGPRPGPFTCLSAPVPTLADTDGPRIGAKRAASSKPTDAGRLAQSPMSRRGWMAWTGTLRPERPIAAGGADLPATFPSCPSPVLLMADPADA